MSHLALRNPEAHLRAVLARTPVTAARYGVLGMVHDGLIDQGLDLAEHLVRTAAPLCSALGVEDVYGVPAALQQMVGRPPRAVADALCDPQLVKVLYLALDAFGLFDLADDVRTWSRHEDVAIRSLSNLEVLSRSELVVQLRRRCGELINAWRDAGGVDLAPTHGLDGRALTAAARAWQLPLVNGALPAKPTAAAALYPNRLGRTAAVVAISRARQALSMSCPAPEEWVFEALAMVIAVGEAIGPKTEHVSVATLSKGTAPGEVPVEVASGPVGDSGFSIDRWWPTFDSWGSQSPVIVRAIPTAWRLRDWEADVLVWALCSAAVRLAVAASAPSLPSSRSFRALGEVPTTSVDPWPAHMKAELPVWEAGAQSVWKLMQSARLAKARAPWPGCSVPLLSDDASWPWQSPSDGKLAGVPAGESGA